MTDHPIDAQTLKDLPQGALETLLSTARAETGAAVAFVALYRADGSFAITTSMDEDASWEGHALASLARSIWLDPDLTVGKVLVSSARVEGGRMKRRQAHVASVVLSDAATSDLEWGLLSIISPTDRKFGEEQVDRVVALSKNLAAYLSARERMIDDLMDTVHEEPVSRSAPPPVERSQHPDVEDFIMGAARSDDVSSARAPAEEASASPGEVEEPTATAYEEDIASPIIRSRDEEIDLEFDELAARVGTNGVRDVPVRTVGDEPSEVHIIPTQPHQDSAAFDEAAFDEAAFDEAPFDEAPFDEAAEIEEIVQVEEIEEVDLVVAPRERTPRHGPTVAEEEDDMERATSISELTMRVAEPGLVDQIGDAMDAIGRSIETVALIHLRIAYEDTAAVVPTEAARALVAQSMKDCVRYDDNVSRVGENSFVVVARLRPGSPKASALEKRLMKAARRATGWSDAGPTFSTDHLVVDADSIDDPEDLLLSLLHH